jgi:hypothetical protein
MGLLDAVLNKYNVTSDVKILTTAPEKHKAYKTSFRKSGNFPDNKYHQMDVLFLPKDQTGHKYLLVVTDIGTGAVDARPMKFKKASKASKRKKGDKDYGKKFTTEYNKADGVLEYVQDIYKSGKYLKEPRVIHVDAGQEFNEVKKYYKKKNITTRTAMTARHSQQAVVEAMNKMIGSVITKIQLNNALSTGGDEDGEERDWIPYLEDILVEANKRKIKPKNQKPKKGVKGKDEKDVLCREDTKECETYSVGDKVRVMLDYPQWNTKRLFGDFRAGDVRWSLRPYTITNILINPNYPIRYVVKGDNAIKENRATYSKFEIKPFKQVKTKVVKPKYEIEKLLLGTTLYPNKSRKGKKAWLVKWKGYNDKYNMLQFEDEIKKDIGNEQFSNLKKGVKSRQLKKDELEKWSKDSRTEQD